ncbi:unnamed protein product [Cochlearia groenlandica]
MVKTLVMKDMLMFRLRLGVLPVDLSAKSKRFIRPMPVLTNFVYPEMEGERKYKKRREEKHTREVVKEKMCQEIQNPKKTRDVM